MPSYDSAPHSPPCLLLSRQQAASLFQSYCVSSVELTNVRGEGREEVGMEPNHTTQESVALYKLFNTFWTILWSYTVVDF
jgi:hypothetical protein